MDDLLTGQNGHKFIIMIQNFGVSLSRDEMKNILGGVADGSCGNYIVDCGDNHFARPSCGSSECTVSSNQSGVTCGGTSYTNSEICKAAFS